jgi:hypothetical protein
MTFRLFCTSLNQNFKLVKIITDDQSDCIFSDISDAILTPNKDVIILDARESFIARFDWNGNFINRIGQKGKGAGDFLWPTSADIFNGKLYILDRFNNRLAESDLELNNLRYFKLSQKITMPRIVKVLDEKNFLIDYIPFNNPNAPKICIIDTTEKVQTKINSMFFNHTPIRIDSKGKDNRTLSRLAPLCGVVYAMDDNKKKMMITFRLPDKLMYLFLYNMKGELIKKFSYQMDERCHFPHFLYKSKKPSLSSMKGRYGESVDNIFYYNGHWYIFVNTHHYLDVDYEMTVSNLKKHTESKSFYLKFDEDGTFVGKFDTDPFFLCFHISKDGYVLGKHPDSEVEQVMIYKLLK